MPTFRRFLALMLLSAAAAGLVGCASSSNSAYTGPGPAPSSQTTADGDRVSSIPWNKPQRWESGGTMGSVMGGN